jgi:hypothetical protein
MVIMEEKGHNVVAHGLIDGKYKHSGKQFPWIRHQGSNLTRELIAGGSLLYYPSSSFRMIKKGPRKIHAYQTLVSEGSPLRPQAQRQDLEPDSDARHEGIVDFDLGSVYQTLPTPAPGEVMGSGNAEVALSPPG